MRSGEIPSGIDLWCTSAKAPVRLAEERPRPADLSGLAKHGDWALATSRRGRAFLCAALDGGEGRVKLWATELVQVTDAADS